MGDMGDVFRAMRDSRKEINRARFENIHANLSSIGFDYEIKNEGHHVIFTVGKVKFDFWPSTGKFMSRNNGKRGVGLNRLINIMKVLV